jgi:hypothetical protein
MPVITQGQEGIHESRRLDDEIESTLPSEGPAACQHAFKTFGLLH